MRFLLSFAGAVAAVSLAHAQCPNCAGGICRPMPQSPVAMPPTGHPYGWSAPSSNYEWSKVDDRHVRNAFPGYAWKAKTGAKVVPGMEVMFYPASTVSILGGAGFEWRLGTCLGGCCGGRCR